MAKRKPPTDKSSGKLLHQKETLHSPTGGWNSMTNWLIVLVTILPLLFSRAVIDPTITPRYLFLCWFVLLFILFFFLFRKKQINLSFPHLIKLAFLVSMGYAVWSLISLFFAINFAEVWYEVGRYLLNIVLMYLVMITVKQEGVQILKLCKALMITSLIQSLVGLLQLNQIAFSDIPGAGTPYGLMANRTLFGSAQALMLPFAIFVLYKGSKGWKFASIAALIGIVISLLISQTRSAWLAGMGVVIISFILIVIFSRQNRRIWIIGTLIGIISITGIVILSLVTSYDDSFSKLTRQKAFTLVQPKADSATTSGRLILWRKSLKLINDYPVIGVGPGNWKLAIPLYTSEGIGAWASGFVVPSRPHNVYLQMAGETGIPGALLYFGLWLVLALIAFKIIMKPLSEDVRALIILMISGLAAFAIDSFFSFPTERIEHSLYFVLMGGIIMGSYANITNAKSEKRLLMNFWMLIAAVSIALFNLFLGYKKYYFEKHMNLAKGYRNEQRYLEAISEVELGKNKFVTLDPHGEPLEIHSSAAYVELKNYEKALEEIMIAKNYHPNSARIFTTMGVIYSQLKQYDKATACYLQALKLTPRYETAMKNLAVVYFVSGNYIACIEILEKVNIQTNKYLKDLLSEAQRRLKENK